VHFSDEGADELASWLNPQLEKVATALAGSEPEPPASTATSPTTTSPTTTTVPVDLTVVGDSLSVGLYPPVQAGIDGHAGATSHVGFAGFLYYDPGRAWDDVLGDTPRDVVVLFFATWENIALRSGQVIDATRPGWQDEYRRTYVEPFLEDARRLAGDVIWVAMPAIRDDTNAAQHRELNAIWAAAAANEPTIAWIDGAAVLGGPGGEYLEIDTSVEPPERLFATDGLHLCPPGAERLATAVLETLERIRGVEPRAGWVDGAWRLDPAAYQPGDCPDPATP
jgi:hypothetical protein